MDTSRPPNDAPARLWSLDALRGVCAGIVFLSHWHLWSHFPPVGAAERAVRTIGEGLHDAVALLTWPTGGQHPAVIAFFVLSGFCIYYPTARRQRLGEPATGWRNYFRRRFLRIAPVYWAASVLGLGFVAAEAWRPSADTLLTLHAIASHAEVGARFLGVAGAYPREILAGNYILNTVSGEILMYAAYPAFLFFATRSRWILLSAAFLGLQVVAVASLKHLSPYWVFNSVLMLGIFWHAGALAAHLFLTRRGHVTALHLVAAWVGFLALKSVPHFSGLNLLKQAAWGLVCFLGLLWAVRFELRHGALGEHRVIAALRRLGGISYSLYAVHTPVIMLVSWALIQGGSRSYTLQLALTLTASLLATWIVHRCVERPFHRAQHAS
ncbi:MAG: acyltransferase [Opitutaceae bacterium]|nr:acyltransferase [Opitutaceae bacterium]